MGLFKQFKVGRTEGQSGATGAAGPYSGFAGAGIPQQADIPPGDPRLAAIEGVSLDMYAQVSKVAATRGLNQAGLNAYVESRGIDPAGWALARSGWNARFTGDMQLATQFGRLYQQTQV